MNAAGVLFLMYHEIESPGKKLCNLNPGYIRYVVVETEFKRQLELMRSAGLRGVSVSEALVEFRDHRSASVELTFDDGCQTDFTVSAPILRSMEFNATLFVVAGFVGAPHFLTASQLRELHKAGFEIGSHSMTHRHLTDLDDKELAKELRESKDCLEQIIGANVIHISCPNGRWSPRVAQFAREAGYKTISTSRIARNFPNSDRLNLARFPVMRDTSPEEFSRLISGANLAVYQRKAALLKLAKQALGNRIYDKLRSKLLGHAG